MATRRTNRPQDVEIQKIITKLLANGSLVKGGDGHSHFTDGVTIESVIASVDGHLASKGIPLAGGVAKETVEDFIALVAEAPLKKSRNGKGGALLQLRSDFEAFKAEILSRLDDAGID